jgi:type III pantothenate kinase
VNAWRLYLNVGNTSAQIGLWSGDRWLCTLREPAGSPLTALWALAADLRLAPAALESVAACVSAADATLWEAAAEAILGRRLEILGRDFFGALETRYRDPRQLGADRVANLVAARAAGYAPCLILDAGTCLTADLLDATGVHQGGAITPGLPAARAGILLAAPHLAPATPALPLEALPAGLGLDTAENLALGLAAALGGTAQALVDRLGQMTESPAQVILTGGDAEFLAAWLPGPTLVRPDLTLDGLRISYESGES